MVNTFQVGTVVTGRGIRVSELSVDSKANNGPTASCECEERNRVNPVDVEMVEESNFFGDNECFSPPRIFGVEEPNKEWVIVEEE